MDESHNGFKIFIALVCFAVLIMPVHAALPNNAIAFSGVGRFLDPIHGDGRNYTWVTAGIAYGDINGKVTWFEEGYKTNNPDQYSSFEGWVNGTLFRNDGTESTYEIGRKGGVPYKYQCLAASNAEECLKNPTTCRFRMIRVTGPLYIDGTYVKYYNSYVLGAQNYYFMPV